MSHRLPSERSETVFSDYKEAYSAEQARVEASRCLFCHDAPCIKACPTSIDIPQFIRKIATGNEKNSARTIFESNILGMSCARVCPVEVLCVGDCVYNHMDQPPIQIGKLQRFATDVAFMKKQRFFEAGPDSGKSVALVGSGPASLAAAHELRRAGHACTIYEKRDVTGGLNTTGVAPYKMKSDRSIEEVDWILGIGGIDTKTGVTIGVDLTFEDLEKDHDAVFIGFGLGADSKLSIPGEEFGEVRGAVEFIEELKLGKVDLSSILSCAVIGAGNTAVDCVRQLLGLGVQDVTMMYRGPKSRMSGYAHEWKAATTEGARAEWHVTPESFRSLKATRHGCVLTYQSKEDANAPTSHESECQLVLVAIGQSKLGELVDGLTGIELDGGRIVTDEHGQTGRPGFFAGGDCTNGGKEVVNAAADGKKSAIAMDRYLRGMK